MKVLVLGGAGFIGQHLAHKLLKDRQTRVIVVDSLATARFNKEDFAHYKNMFEFIEGDLKEMDDAVLLKLFKRADIIYHLAGSVGVALNDKDPKTTYYNNIKLANKLIPLFEQSGTHVVFSSTSEIYGDGPDFHEEDNVGIGPSHKLRWAYATSKLATEFMIRVSTFPYTIVRLFNVVGPGQLGDYGMVLPRFINAAKAGENLIVHGDGAQIRSFCHVSDCIDALIAVSKYDGELFNIGSNDQPISMEDLAKTVIQLTGSTSSIVKVPYEQMFSDKFFDIQYRVPNLDKLREFINYRPKHSLVDIIKDMQ